MAGLGEIQADHGKHDDRDRSRQVVARIDIQHGGNQGEHETEEDHPRSEDDTRQRGALRQPRQQREREDLQPRHVFIVERDAAEREREIEQRLRAGQQHDHETRHACCNRIDVFRRAFGQRQHPMPEARDNSEHQDAGHDPGGGLVPGHPRDPDKGRDDGQIIDMDRVAHRLDAFPTELGGDFVVGFKSDQPIYTPPKLHSSLKH